MRRTLLVLLPLLFWCGIALLLLDFALYNLTAAPPQALLYALYMASVACLSASIAGAVVLAYTSHGKVD